MHNAIPRGFRQICIPDKDCSGLNCSVTLNYGQVRMSTNVRFWWDSHRQESFVSVENSTVPLKNGKFRFLPLQAYTQVNIAKEKSEERLISLFYRMSVLTGLFNVEISCFFVYDFK